MKTLRGQSGQLVIEAVLLMVVFFMAVSMVAQYFRDNAVVRTLIQGPWTHVQGMVESGVWAPAVQAKSAHPNLRERHSTVRGDGG